MSLVRRTLVCLTLTSVTAGGLAATVPSQAVAAGGASCHERHHIPKYKSGTISKQVIINQVGAETLPPGGSRSVVFKVSQVDNVKAGATVSGSYSAKIGNKLIGEAEVSVGLQLSASGSTTKSSSTTITEKVANRTKRNQKYVAFRGTNKVSGGVLQSYCSTPGSNPNGTVKWRRVGAWQTFTFVDKGHARCSAGSTGAVSREAMKIACQ